MALPIRPTGRGKKRDLQIRLDKFRGGVNKLVEEARVKQDEAVEALNLIQVQDGLYKPRWGRDYYGQDLGEEIDGAGEFVKSDGSREIIAVAGGTAYKSTDGGTWSSISGASFTAGTRVRFLQIGGFLYAYNGVDSMARYNGTVFITYTEIDAPENVQLSRGAGLSAGNFTYYYQVTAVNEVGETVASTETSITVNKTRDTWVGTDNEYIDVSWDAVAGATLYQIYMSEVGGEEVLLSSSTTNAYRDNNTANPNIFIDVPDDNTTGAPKFAFAWISDNRLWGTNDPDAPFKVHFSGTGSFLGRFSDYYDGGWINLERGGRETPKAGAHYQTGQGEGKSTIFCATPEGKGSVWQIGIQSATVADDTFAVPSAQKIVGSVGTNSPDGVVLVENDVFFPNKRGVFSLGPEKQYFGILRTNELSSKVRPYWRNLQGSEIEKVSAYYYDSKVFFSVSTSGSGNNRTLIYDRERLNWIVDWNFGFKAWMEYTDSSGNTHLLGVPEGGTQLVEVGEQIVGDFGQAFKTSYISPRIPMSDDWKKFARVRRAYIKLGNPKGTINFEVLGTEKSKGYSAIAAESVQSDFSLTGMGWDLMGSVPMGDTLGVPTAFTQATDIRWVKVNKRIRDIQFRISSESVDTDFVLLGLMAEGRLLDTSPPSSWKIN